MLAAYAVIFVVALGASVLTFFSGFGLGTILMPVLAFYIDLKAAIAVTAIVHLANNVFKGLLLFKHIHIRTFLAFALPALAGTIIGAWLLSGARPVILGSYTAFDKVFFIELYKLLIALLMLFILVIEWVPQKYFSFTGRFLVPGGLITGFCGGYTGMQGALRSSFLVKLNWSKEQYIATSTAISMLIDSVRIAVYAFTGIFAYAWGNENLLGAGVAGALLGALLGQRLLKKITFGFIRILTSICIVFFAVALAAGLIH